MIKTLYIIEGKTFMKNKKINERIVINREELHEIIRKRLTEDMLDANEKLFAALCGKEYTEINYIEKLLPKEDIFAVMSGYLYMSLVETGYHKKEILNIMKRLEGNYYDFTIALQAYAYSNAAFLKADF